MEIINYESFGINKWLEQETSLLANFEDIQFYSTLEVDPETGETKLNEISAGLTTVNTGKMSQVEIDDLLGSISATQLTSGDISQPINLVSGHIQSANFTTGTTGWQINADGDAEFNSGTFRGDLIAGSIHIPDEDTTANSFHTNSSGDSWWGCTKTNFNTDNDNANAYILKTGVAKFQSVSVVGGVLDGTTTLGGRVGSTLASAINSSGNFLDTRLNTSTKEILSDFTFGASGAIKMTTDVNNGLWLSPTGILGKKASATTFSIDTSGNATFSGDITGSIITGGTVQTGTSGQRVVLASDTISIYDASALRMQAFGGQSSWTYFDTSGGVMGGMEGNVSASFGSSSTYGLQFGVKTGPSDAAFHLGVYNDKVETYIKLVPGNDDQYDLGGSTQQWKDLYIDGIAYIDGVGETLPPSSNDAYDLGTSAANWRKIYITDSASHGIYFGSTQTLYFSGGDLNVAVDLDVSGNIDATGNVECANLSLNNGGNTLIGDGTHVEFNGTSNAHLVPESGLIDSAQIGTSTNYWNQINYGSGGLVDRSATPSFTKKDEITLLNKMKKKNNSQKVDKTTVDNEFKSDGGIRLDSLVIALVGAIQKLDSRLKKVEGV